MRDALTESKQHRAHPIQIRCITTHHDCQAAGLGTNHSAGHRCIQPAHAGFTVQLRRHLTRCGGFKTGEIHQQLPGLRAFGNTSRAEHHVAHDRRIGQTQHHHVGVRAQLGGARHLPGTGFDQWRTLGRVAVPHR
ncbi:hypothetical protein BK671_26290 [Pseudomonas fluorescens]|uniref:Uncharacterized protein n=1 Tax=Pseudomonas fluorescens TaxID=294 RepID=A0A423KYK2_PSEFL|nr:hypothetical protein BK671_26290 [Pseudomonas fluorescens]